MKLLSLCICACVVAVGCASHTSYYVGSSTEDLVLHEQDSALYTRTKGQPGPLLDKVFAGRNQKDAVWRLQLQDGQIINKQEVLADCLSRPLKIVGTTTGEFQYAPLGLYLHPADDPVALYVLNASKSTPGFFVVPLKNGDKEVTFVSARPFSTSFKVANSLAVHPDGTVFVSIYDPVKALGYKKDLVVGDQIGADALRSVLAYQPGSDSGSGKWRTAVGDLPGANGMAFHSGADGNVDLFISNYSGKKLIRFDASDPFRLKEKAQVKLQFHPDNLTVHGNRLFVAGQNSLLPAALNVFLTSAWPLRSSIVIWNVNEEGAQLTPAMLQPPFGPAVSTAVPYRDVIYCGHITGSTIRTLHPR